jgi:hypothetical protein
MEIAYRRRLPVSRLERLLSRLVLGLSRPRPPDPRVDLVLELDVEFRQV